MEMLSLEKELKENSYPGRGIVIGRSADGKKAVTAYFIMGRSDDIELGFTMYEEEENGWRCSFRSDGKWINVNELLKPFGGGGHISAAGLKYRTDNVEELKKQILDRVAEMKNKQ